MLFLIVLVLSLVQFSFLERRVHYAGGEDRERGPGRRSAAPLRSRLRSRGSWRKVGRYAALTFAAVIVLFPIYSAVVVAIQPAQALLQWPGILLPTDIDLGTFREAFVEGDLGLYLRNSLIQSSLITVGQVSTSILAAYAFAFLRFPGKRCDLRRVPGHADGAHRGHRRRQRSQIVSDLGWLNT